MSANIPSVELLRRIADRRAVRCHIRPSHHGGYWTPGVIWRAVLGRPGPADVQIVPVWSPEMADRRSANSRRRCRLSPIERQLAQLL